MKGIYLLKILKSHLLHLVLALGLVGTCAAQDENPRVLMSTALGDIEIELFLDRAPVTADNFLRMVQGGFLDGGSFYRTVTYENDNGSPKIEVIQGGLNNEASPFDPIRHESTAETGILHLDGVISMARGGVGTASSEFFICIGDQPGLDHGQPRNEDGQGFAAFGRVVSGMDVVRAINGQATLNNSDSEYTSGQIIANPVVITTVTEL